MRIMRRACILLVVVTVLISYAQAQAQAQAEEGPSMKQAVGDDATNLDDDDDYDDDYDYALQDKKGHKHKHKYKFPLFLKGGFVKDLVAFIAIKIKIILVVITVIGIVGFTLKVFGALKYAGYVGGSECPIASAGPVIHEPAYGLGYSATPPPDHNQEYGYGTDHGSSDWSSGEYARSLINNYIDTDFFTHALKNMDMAEVIFSTLEMDDDLCRRRLVCEIDAKTRQLPFLSYAMNFFSNGFEKYKTPVDMKYDDCAKLYSGCKDKNNKTKRRKRFAAENNHRNHTPT